jgi:glutathione peroxidase
MAAQAQGEPQGLSLGKRMVPLCVVLLALLAGACTPRVEGTVTNIDGEQVDLAKYRGKVLVIVNVASECGYTPQYADLQALYAKYRDRGVEVLAFPSNDFGGQEPNDRAAIKQFAQTEYGATFPMFDKVHATGPEIAPLFALLTTKALPEDKRGPVKWNFEKFVVDRSGKVVARFPSKVEPLDPQLTQAIESAL